MSRFLPSYWNAVTQSKNTAYFHKASIGSVAWRARWLPSRWSWTKVTLPFSFVWIFLHPSNGFSILQTDLDSVDFDLPEWSEDINNVTSVLKMWFRELPDPLLTNSLHQGFVDAASMLHRRITLSWKTQIDFFWPLLWQRSKMTDCVISGYTSAWTISRIQIILLSSSS